MNRAALKAYAPKARLDFIHAVRDRAAFFGLTPDRTEPMQATGDVVIIGGRAFPKAVASQRRSLEGRIQRLGFDQVMEAMAYTWFNRVVALRYMELHGYLDHGYRVLSHPEGKATPEIVEHAEHATLPGLDNQKVIELKLDGTKEAELYRLLLVAQCNALHEAMPFLFERIADDTELLLPDNLLHSDSLIRKLVNEIEEADWQQVEIIGWLYQFYISDKKAEVIGKVVKSEDIPAATQLFTPNWIVKYLVQNTLGRQWLATYPDSPLRQQMEYYIEPAEQTDDVKAQLAAITPKSLDPEKLTLLDPASGSGHILVEGYDLFKAIYQERGYRAKDIPRLILEKNLFGLEIDDRAAQLAAFALLMKARADDRRIFADRIQPNVLAIQESKGLESLLRPDAAATARAGDSPFADSDLFPDKRRQLTLTTRPPGSPLVAVEPFLRELIKLFEHGKTFGSLIRVPPDLATQLPAARQSIEAMIATGQLWEHRAATLLLPLVKQAEMLARTYNAVVTNPPYMGSKGMNGILKEFTGTRYPETKSDLFATFIEQGYNLAHAAGMLGMVTMQSWMFLSSYRIMREKLLRDRTLFTLAHLGPRAFSSISGEVVQTVAFACQGAPSRGFRPTFFRLIEDEEEAKQRSLLRRENKHEHTLQGDFEKIPGSPIAYWVGDSVRASFQNSNSLGKLAFSDGKNITGNNAKYQRFFWEVSQAEVGAGLRWLFIAKGGGFQKWVGNHDSMLDWSEQARSHYRRDPIGRIIPEYLWSRRGVTWSLIAASSPSFRFLPSTSTFSDVGLFFHDETDIPFVLGFLNSVVAELLLGLLNPTVNLPTEVVLTLPIARMSERSQIEARVEELIALSNQEWKFREESWTFMVDPLVGCRRADEELAESWQRWKSDRFGDIAKMKSLEGENNRAFISGYEIRDCSLSERVVDEDITLSIPNRSNDTTRLISYGLGCMMGRYSLDKPGLVYAHSRNKGFDPSQYCTFPADADGIMPITELAWFPDDATERFVEFITKAWPREHLEENLKFIADSLGPNRDEHPRDTIRRYLVTGFYKDHLQTYKKRPIYWFFSSGKQRAFQCLVYLHRYHEGTLARMRTEYVIPLQGKLSQRIEQLAGDIAAATSTSHRRKLEKERETLVKQRTELAAFDEKLRHYADQRIALDLDDGVKVNYGKFGDLLAEVKAVTGGTEE